MTTARWDRSVFDFSVSGFPFFSPSGVQLVWPQRATARPTSPNRRRLNGRTNLRVKPTRVLLPTVYLDASARLKIMRHPSQSLRPKQSRRPRSVRDSRKPFAASMRGDGDGLLGTSINPVAPSANWHRLPFASSSTAWRGCDGRTVGGRPVGGIDETAAPASEEDCGPLHRDHCNIIPGHEVTDHAIHDPSTENLRGDAFD